MHRIEGETLVDKVPHTHHGCDVVDYKKVMGKKALIVVSLNGDRGANFGADIWSRRGRGPNSI